MPSSHGNVPLLRWVLLVVSLAALSANMIVTIEVDAWVFYPDTSKNHRSPIQFSHRTKTSLPLYQKGEQQKEFFFNTTTGLKYTNDDTTADITTNETAAAKPSSPPKKGSASGNFGDIMSPTIDDADLLFQDGLVTSETYSLEEIYGISNPLDRMAVTANGNLQRLFSSYYDAPVVVEMVHCTRQKQRDANGDATTATWDRRVLLKLFGDQTFCTADSIVKVHSKDVEDLVESGQVGIGQLFRHFNILPEFMLRAAGPTEDGGFWRNYTLESDLVTCSIREVFCKNVWELSPSDNPE